MLQRVVAASSASIWISLSKWPMLDTIALFFMAAMCSTRMMSLLPVVVTTMSTTLMTVSNLTTGKPSIEA